LHHGPWELRALVELREVLTEQNHAEVLARAEGKSQEEAQLLAVEYKPKPVPRDVVRALPMPPAPFAAVPAETEMPPRPPEVVKPLTPDLRRLNVTVSADFMAELEQARAALSHKIRGLNDHLDVPPRALRHPGIQLFAPLTRSLALFACHPSAPPPPAISYALVNRAIASAAQEWIAGPTHDVVAEALSWRRNA
jgi:hypothetical protein